MADVADYSRGMHWIGHAGALVPFKDRGSVSVTDDVEPSIQVSLGGVRRARVSRNRPPRSWSLSMPDAHADDVAHVRSLMTATLPPYQLVTAEAQVSNVLTPERSTLTDSGLALGGWWPIAGQYEGGGTLARLNPSAAFGSVATVTIGPCPVPPTWTGRQVTASVYVATARAEGARVVILWRDSAGAPVSPQANGNFVSGMDGLRRSTVTATPPAGAVACELRVQWAEVIARPQVTWTDVPIPEWTVGNGADRVVITGLDRDTELQVPDSRNLRRASYSLNLTEVGP